MMESEKIEKWINSLRVAFQIGMKMKICTEAEGVKLKELLLSTKGDSIQDRELNFKQLLKQNYPSNYDEICQKIHTSRKELGELIEIKRKSVAAQGSSAGTPSSQNLNQDSISNRPINGTFPPNPNNFTNLPYQLNSNQMQQMIPQRSNSTIPQQTGGNFLNNLNTGNLLQNSIPFTPLVTPIHTTPMMMNQQSKYPTNPMTNQMNIQTNPSNNYLMNAMNSNNKNIQQPKDKMMGQTPTHQMNYPSNLKPMVNPTQSSAVSMNKPNPTTPYTNMKPPTAPGTVNHSNLINNKPIHTIQVNKTITSVDCGLEKIPSSNDLKDASTSLIPDEFYLEEIEKFRNSLRNSVKNASLPSIVNDMIENIDQTHEDGLSFPPILHPNHDLLTHLSDRLITNHLLAKEKLFEIQKKMCEKIGSWIIKESSSTSYKMKPWYATNLMDTELLLQLSIPILATTVNHSEESMMFSGEAIKILSIRIQKHLQSIIELCLYQRKRSDNLPTNNKLNNEIILFPKKLIFDDDENEVEVQQGLKLYWGPTIKNMIKKNQENYQKKFCEFLQNENFSIKSEKMEMISNHNNGNNVDKLDDSDGDRKKKRIKMGSISLDENGCMDQILAKEMEAEKKGKLNWIQMIKRRIKKEVCENMMTNDDEMEVVISTNPVQKDQEKEGEEENSTTTTTTTTVTTIYKITRDDLQKILSKKLFCQKQILISTENEVDDEMIGQTFRTEIMIKTS